MNRFRLRHPSSGRLHQWLMTGEPAAVCAHVEQCSVCADRLEVLDSVEIGSTGEAAVSLRDALTAIVAPPPNLSVRVQHSVQERQRRERELSLFAGLFTVGVETAQLMFDQSAGARPIDETEETT